MVWYVPGLAVAFSKSFILVIAVQASYNVRVSTPRGWRGNETLRYIGHPVHVVNPARVPP